MSTLTILERIERIEKQLGIMPEPTYGQLARQFGLSGQYQPPQFIAKDIPYNDNRHIGTATGPDAQAREQAQANQAGLAMGDWSEKAAESY